MRYLAIAVGVKEGVIRDFIIDVPDGETGIAIIEDRMRVQYADGADHFCLFTQKEVEQWLMVLTRSRG